MITQQRLAALTRTLVRKVDGGEEEAAKIVRVSRSLLRKAQNANDPYALSIADVVALEEYVGEPVITAELAAIHDRPVGGDLCAATVMTCKEVADVLTEAHAAMADGVMTPVERIRVRKELDEAKAAVALIDAALDGHESASLRAVAAE